MVNIFRRYQQPLMIVITVFIIVAFAWLYNDTRVFSGGEDRIGTVYDRDVAMHEYDRNRRIVEVASALQQIDYIEDLATGPRTSRDQLLANVVLNSIILRHEAEAMGLSATPAEIEKAITSLPVFQTNGTFDSSKYNQFLQFLPSRGFTPPVIEEIVRDRLLVEKVKSVLAATVPPAPSEVREAFAEGNQRADVSYLVFKTSDFEQGITVSDEDVKKAYEERKSTLMTDEERKVKFAAFKPTEEQQKLPMRERSPIMQELANNSADFAAGMLEKDANFDELAKKFKGTVGETEAFTMDDPPEEFGESPEAATAAFKLTKEQPNSDPITTNNGYFVLQLTEIIPAREKTFDEAKAQLSQALKQERAAEALELKMTEVRNKIAAEVKAGKTFAEAAQAAGVKAEQFSFSFAEAKFDPPVTREIANRTRSFEAGQLSDPLPVSGGKALALVEKRHPIDEQKFAQERPKLADTLTENYVSGQRFFGQGISGAFELWLTERRAAANASTVFDNAAPQPGS